MQYLLPVMAALIAVILAPAVVAAPAVNSVGDAPAKRTLKAAHDCLGKKMWSGYGLTSGKLGCAAALGNVLKLAGLPYRGSAAVVSLRQQILNGPLEVREIPVKQSAEYGVDPQKLRQVSRPGDLIFGYKENPGKPNLGADAHCGVVADSGRVYANDWNDGIWKCDVADRFFAWYPHVYVMRMAGPKDHSK